MPDNVPNNDSNKSMSTQDMIDFLKDDTETLDLDEKSSNPDPDIDRKEDDKEDQETDKDSDSDKPDEKPEKGDDDTEKEDEIDLDELEDEEKEIIEPISKRAIKVKYPNFFKEFPDVEKAIYRERAYSEILPTVEAAKEAVEDQKALHGFEASLDSGTTADVLKAVKEHDEEAFNRIVDNYLPSLRTVHQEAYYHVVGNVIKDMIVTMVNEKDADLTEAARIVNKYIFGVNQFQPPVRMAKDGPRKPEDKEDAVGKREQEYLENKYKTESSDLETTVNNSIKSTIDKYIDPKESMTPYIKRQATRDALEAVVEQMENDRAFQKMKDKLWLKAKEDNFSRNSIGKIKSALINKAKTLLPAAIKSARNEALRGTGKRVADDNVDRKGPLPRGAAHKDTGSSTANKGGKSYRELAKEIPKGMSTRDFLMKDL